MTTLDGRALSQEWREALKSRVKEWAAHSQQAPSLAVVLVGEDPASQVYVSHKIKACESVGIRSIEHRLPSQSSQEDVIRLVQKLNNDDSVNGILVQLPLPKEIDALRVLDELSPLKDADGLTTENLGRLAAGRPRVIPCTPHGVIQLLKKYNVPLSGQRAVVVGRSQIVGKPMALLLLAEDATVTICHSRTVDLREHLQKADIAIVAAGRPEFLGRDDFKKGAVVVDVGIHRGDKGRLCGDVRSDELTDVVEAITPVPGGVGPMTIAMLLENTLLLAQEQAEGRLK